ncbi:unnamed protein product [Mytilus edulis]|uniref:Uncharacterized protein n=1 Tax=Mytilus edulis TaxID=6550 RepID=A0A8S3TQS0_MYTED|nr:unnamed protein product [Mytilus edulis]
MRLSKGFSATDCHLTPCDNFPCKNQERCENIGSGRNCNCKEGYTGKDCEKTPCSGSPCNNGGFCSIQNLLKQKTCNITPCLKDWIFYIATFSCYWIDIRKANWSSANEICQSKRPSFVYIQTLDEIKWLEHINEDVWVGGREINNQYRWHSIEYNYTIHNLSYSWTPNEPGEFNRDYCVQLWKRNESFLLDITACYYEKRFICKTTNIPGF